MTQAANETGVCGQRRKMGDGAAVWHQNRIKHVSELKDYICIHCQPWEPSVECGRQQEMSSYSN